MFNSDFMKIVSGEEYTTIYILEGKQMDASSGRDMLFERNNAIGYAKSFGKKVNVVNLSPEEFNQL